jgi:CDGSH-type Zn-finger protein
MNKPVTPQKNPYKAKVEKGKTYSWCTCGLSQKQPFCDGSHKKESKFKSLKFLAEEDKEIYFCGCKMTSNAPFCDGTHIKL